MIMTDGWQSGNEYDRLRQQNTELARKRDELHEFTSALIRNSVHAAELINKLDDWVYASPHKPTCDIKQLCTCGKYALLEEVMEFIKKRADIK